MAEPAGHRGRAGSLQALGSRACPGAVGVVSLVEVVRSDVGKPGQQPGPQQRTAAGVRLLRRRAAPAGRGPARRAGPAWLAGCGAQRAAGGVDRRQGCCLRVTACGPSAGRAPSALVGTSGPPIRGLGRPDVVLVGYMGHADVHLARLRYPRSVIALDHLVGLSDTLRDRHLGGGLRLRLLDLADRAALMAADVVVVDTALHAQLLPVRMRAKAVVTPVGAGQEWFDAGRAAARRTGPAAPPNREGASPPLRVVFVGLFTPLQGAPTIGRAVDLLRDEAVEFTLVGHGQDLAATRSLARGSDHARWLDWVPAAEPAGPRRRPRRRPRHLRHRPQGPACRAHEGVPGPGRGLRRRDRRDPGDGYPRGRSRVGAARGSRGPRRHAAPPRRRQGVAHRGPTPRPCCRRAVRTAVVHPGP